MNVTFKGNPVTLAGSFIIVGRNTPQFNLVKNHARTGL